MWGSTFAVDSRKNCFITVPQKWGIDLGKLSVVKIQQSTLSNTSPIYATVIGDTGPTGVDTVVMSVQFARANDIKVGKEGTFQLVKDPAQALSTVVAKPISEEDWELLEMNADQIQFELMNRVRVVWKGAKIPIWLSEFMSLTLEIDELDPDCALGMLMENTEIHVSPPVKKPAIIQPVVEHHNKSISSIFNHLAAHFTPKPALKPVKELGTAVRLRVHPICTKGSFETFLESCEDIIPQPYQAFMSQEHCTNADVNMKVQHCLGCIRTEERTCYFTVVFVGDDENWRLNRNAVYLTDNVIQQLKLKVKQRVTVQLGTNFHRNRVEGLTFFTFVNDYDIKILEKETKLWLQSTVGSALTLTLNRGQHLDIPCLIKAKTNRLFVGINPDAEYCCIDQLTLCQIEDKLKFSRISAKNPPNLLCIPGESVPLEPDADPVRLGGMTDFIQQCLTFLNAAIGLSDESVPSVFTGCRHGNLLLTGSRGSGKTSVARHLCNQLVGVPHYVHSAYVDCSALKGKKIETLQREWRSVFQDLLDKQPSVLVLDDLDLLASYPQNDHDDSLNGENWYSTRVAELLWELINSTPFLNQVVVIATAASSKALHPKLNHYQSKHMFSCEQTIPVLSLPMRIDVLRVIFERTGITYDKDDDVLARSAKQMDGYTAADMRNVVEKAAHLAISESRRTEDVHVKGKHIESAVGDHVPFGLYGINFKPPTESRKCWDDVGGLSEAKQMLLETLKWPTQYPELFSHCPIRLRSALLLYGAPGTGKTLLASAVATECAVNFISIKGPELLSKFIGASEEAVRETFRRARSAKPCILFFDEFDSLAPRRGHDSTGVTDRVVNQLLTELDGVEGQEVGLWVLAATSRPDLIDPALLRPGRFDVAVNCPLPNKDERLDILKALSTRLHLIDGVRLESVAEETAHFSGADLQAVLYTAQLKALHEQKQAMDRQPGPIRITQEHLVAALRETRPSVSTAERQQYDRIYRKFQAGRSRNADHSIVDQMGPSRVTLA